MKSRNLSDKVFDFFNYTFLILLFLIVLYPLWFVLIASVSNPEAVYRGDVWIIPNGFSTEGYARVFRNPEVMIGYKNSIFYSVFGTLIDLAVTVSAAYALSRKDLNGRKFFMGFFLFTMFFGGGMIPFYIVVRNLNMLDTIWAVLLPTIPSVWNLIICRTYFETNIPIELLEASRIDGCKTFRFFLTIVIPLSKPIIAVLTLFCAVAYWNSFFNPMIFLNDRTLFPLTIILREILLQTTMQADMISDMKALAEQQRISEVIKYALIIVSSVPVLCIYPFIQKHFVKGIMVGAIKS